MFCMYPMLVLLLTLEIFMRKTFASRFISLVTNHLVLAGQIGHEFASTTVTLANFYT